MSTNRAFLSLAIAGAMLPAMSALAIEERRYAPMPMPGDRRERRHRYRIRTRSLRAGDRRADAYKAQRRANRLRRKALQK